MPRSSQSTLRSPIDFNAQGGKDPERAETSDHMGRSSSVAVKGEAESIYCLSVVGQIEGHYLLSDGQKTTKYEQVIPLLVSVDENTDFDGLLVILNTMGGVSRR